MTPNESQAKTGARVALGLLLGINLFNYIDRFVLAAVEPNIRAAFFAADDVNAMAKTGGLAPAFLLTYMFSAPILGFLADRFSRWTIVGVCVILWSIATAASGFAATFAALFITRISLGSGGDTVPPRHHPSPIAFRHRCAASWPFCGAHSGAGARSVMCARRFDQSRARLALGISAGRDSRGYSGD
jgi:MFS family permease